jgi:hypothetical protein
LLLLGGGRPGVARQMTDPKIPIKFQADDLDVRPSHDLMETARTIELSPSEQEEAVEREKALRAEAAERARVEAAEAEYKRLVAERAAAVVLRDRARRFFLAHAMAWGAGNAAMVAAARLTGGAWFYGPLIGWSLILAAHAVWLIVKAGAVPPAPIAPEPMLSTSRRVPAPRPLAGRGHEEADAEAQARARTTQRTRGE